MTYLEKITALQQMIAEGKMMEGFEQYYHDKVVVIEKPTGDTRNGKAAQRKAIEGWVDMIAERHGGGIHSICSNEETGVTMVQSWTDVTFKQGGRMLMEEVGVQKWEGDQIIHEEFYYNMPGA